MGSQNKLHDRKTMLSLGLILLFVATLASVFLHPVPHLGKDSLDGIKGLLFGVAIGFMLLSLTRRGRGGSRPRNCD